MDDPKVEASDRSQLSPEIFLESAAADRLSTSSAPMLVGVAVASLLLVLQVLDDVRWPTASLVILGVAVLALLASFQFSVWASLHNVTLADGRWTASDRDAVAAHHREFLWWAQRATVLHNFGQVCLLVGVAVTVAPTSTWRIGWCATFIVSVGAFLDSVWSCWIWRGIRRSRRDG